MLSLSGQVRCEPSCPWHLLSELCHQELSPQLLIWALDGDSNLLKPPFRAAGGEAKPWHHPRNSRAIPSSQPRAQAELPPGQTHSQPTPVQEPSSEGRNSVIPTPKGFFQARSLSSHQTPLHFTGCILWLYKYISCLCCASSKPSLPALSQWRALFNLESSWLQDKLQN